jgi:hypothetical protein
MSPKFIRASDVPQVRFRTSQPRPVIPRDLPCGHKLVRIPEHPAGLGRCVVCGGPVDLADYSPGLVHDYLTFYERVES